MVTDCQVSDSGVLLSTRHDTNYQQHFSDTLAFPIAVTAVINLPASGWRKEFVYDCGVIGLCPPCTRATPLAGVGSLLVGGSIQLLEYQI